MAGSYQGFAVKYETSAGVLASVGGSVSVKARKRGAGSDVSTLTTNSDGEIVAGSFGSLSAGDIVDFRIEQYNGMAASIAQTLT